MDPSSATATVPKRTSSDPSSTAQYHYEYSFKFPDSLQRASRCLIALSGLDTRNNAVHRAIWDEFNGGKRNKKPIAYKNVPADHWYPKSSESKLTYEDYVPKGILKSSWMAKHTEELPAVVSFFFDMDWADTQWLERQTECVSKIQVIRSALQKRTTEIVIVLIQSTPPQPVADGSPASERAANLCMLCEIPRLNLYVLPFTDRPQGFIVRLEEAFYEKALSYYAGRIKTVRAHKDLLSKQSHQLVAIRHQFKIAFFTELKQEPSAALKLYRAAYNTLLSSLVMSEDLIMQFKMVAGFINYRICRLSFSAEEPVNTIEQFRRHVDRFAKETGPGRLAYEHAEWMSRQFSAFADLFSECVKRGLTAIQTQHPGVYYHHAALYALERKTLCLRLCRESALKAPSPLPNPPLPDMQYFGQRPWRKDLDEMQVTSAELKLDCIKIMQAIAYNVQHSWQIIPLLNNAIYHFKYFKSGRMTVYLKVLMGQEYYHIMEYEKSLILLRSVTELYRREQWWTLLRGILHTIIRCSYILGRVEEYFITAFEMIGMYIQLSKDEKMRIQKNLDAVFFSGHAPSPEPGVERNALEAAQDLWTNLTRTDQNMEFTVQASSIASCVECKSEFASPSFSADSAVQLTVHFWSSAPMPLVLSSIAVLFHQEEYNQWCFMEEEVTLEPSVVKSLHFSFPALYSSVGESLEVHAVKAVFGRKGVAMATLVWSNGRSEQFSLPLPDIKWDQVPLSIATQIQPHESKVDLSVEHRQPALLGEYYPVRVALRNREAGPSYDLSIHLTLREVLDETNPSASLFECVPPPSSEEQKGSQSLELLPPKLDPGERFEKTVYLWSNAPGVRELLVECFSSTKCKVQEEWEDIVHSCSKEELVTLKTIRPFEVTYKCLDRSLREVKSLHWDCPFLLVTDVLCISPWQLLITGSHFSLHKVVSQVGPSYSQVSEVELCKEDRASECHCFSVSSRPGEHLTSIAIGSYTLHWRRSSDPESCVHTTSIPLSPMPLKHLPFSVTTDIPPCGRLKKVLPVSYAVHNKTIFVQEFEAKMVASEAFMFSGKRLTRFRILPSSSHTLTFNLYPLATGHNLLPRLELSFLREPKPSDDIISSLLPHSVFIEPTSVSPSEVRQPLE